MTELTGPRNCAECGSEFTEAIILAGGSEAATVTIRGHYIPVPTLYRCKGCAMAVQSGMRQSGITVESAREYLSDVAGPNMVDMLFGAEDSQDALKCAGVLQEVLEVQAVLEAVLVLQDEPGGLDFIPECDGKCGGQHPDPRAMAHLN
jgi:hypothetical protein